MKTKQISLKAFIAVACAMSVLFLWPLKAFAISVNCYHGVSYSGSYEEAQEYEEILKSQGYVCVTEGCTENQEWTDEIKSRDLLVDRLGAYLTDDGEDYRLYVSEFDYNQLIEEEANEISFLSNCYVVSYYEFNHEAELGNTSGVVGDELDELGIPYGFVTVWLNVDDELKAQPNLVYSIILEDENGKFYDLSSSSAADNGYIIREKVPCGTFSVYSIFADNSHTVDLSANSFTKTFYIKQSTNRDIIVDFVKVEVDEELADGTMTTHNVDSDNDGKILMEDGVTVNPIVQADPGKPLWFRLAVGIGSFIGIVLVVAVPVLLINKRIKERDNEVG